MRSSLLALEEAVDFLDAPDEFPLIWLAEPCTSVQRWAYVANIWSYSAFFIKVDVLGFSFQLRLMIVSLIPRNRLYICSRMLSAF